MVWSSWHSMWMDALTAQQVLAANLTDWRKLAQSLHTRFQTGTFIAGMEFVNAVGMAAEEANHHPDVKLTYGYVDLALVSHDVGNMITQADIDMARTISRIAGEMGVKSDTSTLTVVELALDSADRGTIGPFWSVLLSGSDQALDGCDVVDLNGQVPLLWFQETEAHPTPKQRFHLDVWVPHDARDARIEAALAAGGTMVDDTQAPAFVVLADAEGNRACVCTMLER